MRSSREQISIIRRALAFTISFLAFLFTPHTPVNYNSNLRCIASRWCGYDY